MSRFGSKDLDRRVQPYVRFDDRSSSVIRDRHNFPRQQRRGSCRQRVNRCSHPLSPTRHRLRPHLRRCSRLLVLAHHRHSRHRFLTQPRFVTAAGGHQGDYDNRELAGNETVHCDQSFHPQKQKHAETQICADSRRAAAHRVGRAAVGRGLASLVALAFSSWPRATAAAFVPGWAVVAAHRAGSHDAWRVRPHRVRASVPR